MERIFNNVKITSSFEIPETRENLVSGETIGQHFGKIAKVIDDLENGEFSSKTTVDTELSDTSENPVQNKVINAALNEKASKDTMTGATSSAAGTSGLVPAPAAGDQDKFLKADGTWQKAGGSNKDCLPLSGGVVTGNVQQSGGTTDYDTYKLRNIGFGNSSTPSRDANFGGNGSIYFYYS